MSKIELLSHVSIIVVCMIASGILIERRFFSTVSAPSDANLVGKKLSSATLHTALGKRTIVLAMTMHCVFCLESMPLYEKLSTIASADARVVVLSPDPPDMVRTYLAEHHVTPSGILQADLATIGVVRTPTLLVVDSQGLVTNAFVGMLSMAREEELFAVLRR